MRSRASYDWDTHQPKPAPKVISVGGGHLLLRPAPTIAEYQSEVALARGRAIPSGHLAVATCEYGDCLSHVQIEPPVRPQYSPGVCVYCGLVADSVDHVLPRSWTGDSARHRVVLVPACRECNTLIGDAYAVTIPDRRAVAQSGLRRKYRRRLGTVVYGRSDLDAMGPGLRAAIVARIEQHAELMFRLGWPYDPTYDAAAHERGGL